MRPRVTSAIAMLVVLTLALAACGDERPAHTIERLTQEIPPCTPVTGSLVKPCDPEPPSFETGATHSPNLGDEPVGLREMLDDGILPPAWVPHLVVRGTYLPETVRCTSADIFRTPSFLQDEFNYGVGTRSFKCYIDLRVNAYVLGSGPSTLTTMLSHYPYRSHEIGEMKQFIEAYNNDLFPGREHIMFLGPAVDLSSETWRFMGFWDVQRREDDTVIAVHPDRDLWRQLRPDEYQTHRSTLEMELPTFTQALAEANQARVDKYDGRIGAETSLPMLITDVNDLALYFREVGAYDSPHGPPAQPPPAGPPPPTPTTVPPQAEASAAEATKTTVWLTWEAPSDPTVSGYRILRRIGVLEPELMIREDTKNATTAFLDDQGIKLGRTYIYRVQAINAVGVGPASLPVKASPGPLPVPQNLRGVSSSDGAEVRLSWDITGWDEVDVANVDGFRVRRRIPKREFVELARLEPTAREYTDAHDFVSGQTYIYRVDTLSETYVGEQARIELIPAP